jgi:hypothetical protein
MGTMRFANHLWSRLLQTNRRQSIRLIQDLINVSVEVTRTKVQKSVVVLATKPVLGSARSKLGMVTQAFFAQRDFTQLSILQALYENLNASTRPPFADATLFSGASCN